jgi:MerR family transcriptional regulator, heat shock protein HspR
MWIIINESLLDAGPGRSGRAPSTLHLRGREEDPGTTMNDGVGRLDDQDYPAVTMGQAAELLGVQPAFLRSLDAAGVLTPQRSGGGHRRYSRRQLVLAARMRELFDQGMTLDAAARIVGLQDELDTARARIGELEAQQGAPHGSDPTP